MSETQSMTAGLVVYTQQPEGWEGIWSHAKNDGSLAREFVSKANLDAIPGAWPVEIRTPKNTILFTGTLSVSILGQCVRLVWTGQKVGGGSARFQGRGYRLNAVTLAATFEEVNDQGEQQPLGPGSIEGP